MLIPREELSYSFGQARFDSNRKFDQEFLGWVFNQFLYGEVTGIQCGYWLYRAPHLNAAAFLAKQAAEEISHVKRIVWILDKLDQKPTQAHRAIRFMATGMMGGSWGEHVSMEMALGEGLVLTIFYALSDTIGNEEIRKVLESAIKDEETHVEFGERETRAWLEQYPSDRKLFLALAIQQVIAMRLLKRFIIKKIQKDAEAKEHPVMSQFDLFYDHLVDQFEVRIARLGISVRKVSEMGFIEKGLLMLQLPFFKVRSRYFRPKRLLTETYLNDQSIQKTT